MLSNSQVPSDVENSVDHRVRKSPDSDPKINAVNVQRRDAAAKLFGFTSNGDDTYSGSGCNRCRLIKAKGNGYLIEHEDR